MSDNHLDNLIVRHLAGSQAYGTSTPTSDTDFRGIFMADKEFILTPFFTVNEVSDSSEEDTKYYELNNYMKLYLDANPNILESLWVDESDIVFSTELYEHLRGARSDFLSSKIAFTYTGYAHNQAKRMKNHHSWMDKERVGVRMLQEVFDDYPCQQTIDWIGDNFPDYIFNLLDVERGRGSYIKTILPINFEKYMRNASLQMLSTQPLKQYHFIKLVHNYFDFQVLDRDFNILNFNHGYQLVPYGDNTFGLVIKEGSRVLNDDGSIHRIDTSNLTLEEVKEQPKMIIKFNKDEYDKSSDNRNNYHNWKKNRNEARSEIEQLYGYDCYQESSTEFLTKDGFKKYDDITEHDLLGTFNKDGVLEWQHYFDRIKKPYSGKLYTLETENTKTVVTNNHRMFISKYSRRKKEFSSFDFIEMQNVPGEFSQLNSISNNFEDNPEYSDAFLALIGAYVSEGSLMKYNNKPKAISISQLKGGRQEKYYELISSEYKTFLYEHVRNERIELTLNIYNKTLAQKLRDLCGEYSENKKLPKFISELSSRQANLLLDVMVSGDGTEREHSRIYYTESAQLAHDTYNLAVIAGNISKMWDYKDKHGIYQIYISNKSKTDITYKRNHLSTKDVTDESVVCFSVPNSTLITRNSGKNGFHGNCKHAMHVVRLLRTAEEALTTGEVLVKRPDAEELLAIRNGAWTFDEMMEYWQEKDQYIREVLYKQTELPKTPNIHAAAKLLIELREMQWYGSK